MMNLRSADAIEPDAPPLIEEPEPLLEESMLEELEPDVAPVLDEPEPMLDELEPVLPEPWLPEPLDPD